MPNSIKMSESRKEEECNYCKLPILAKEQHILVGDVVRFHFRCWEKKKKENKLKYGIV